MARMLGKTAKGLAYLIQKYGGQLVKPTRYPALDKELQLFVGVTWESVLRNGTKLGLAEKVPYKGTQVLQREAAEAILRSIGVDPSSTSSTSAETDEAQEDRKKEAQERIAKRVKGYIDQGGEVQALEYAVKNAKNVLLVGPTGVGKTMLVEELAKKNGAELVTINCDVGTEAQDLIGYKTLVNGEVKWIDGVVTDAMRNGKWPVFDEINFASPEIFGALQAALDHRRALTLKEKDGEIVHAHENFRVFATMNRGYAGTQRLNQAFKDRFALVVALDYLPEAKERDLLVGRTGIDATIAATLVKIGRDTRRNLETPISPRQLLEWSQAIVNGFSPAKAAEFAVLGRIGDDGDRQDVKNIIKNYVKVD